MYYLNIYILELTSESSDEGGGHRFYRDRVKEAYRPLYNWFFATTTTLSYYALALSITL